MISIRDSILIKNDIRPHSKTAQRVGVLIQFLESYNRLTVRGARRILIRAEERRKLSNATVYKVFKLFSVDDRLELAKIGKRRLLVVSIKNRSPS
jgi:hypothetical protein